MLNVRSFVLSFVFLLAFAGQAFRNLLGWTGYGVLVGVVVVGFLVYILKTSPKVPPLRVSPVVVYMGVALLVSMLFSSYLPWSLLGVTVTFVTVGVAWFVSKYYRWYEIKQSLWGSLGFILVASFVLEIVAAVTGVPLLPVYLQNVENPPAAYYWVLGGLFEGQPIQGILGNRNLTSFVGLLFLLLSLFNRELKRVVRILGTLLGVLTLIVTDSATVTVATVGCLVAAGVVYVMRRWRTKYERTKYFFLTLFTGAVLTGVILLYRPIVGLLNREPDMTNRLTIWLNVWDKITQKPVTGWGWLGHWVPDIEPFNDLAVLGGVTHLHAHNAYLDVLFQTGLVGLAGFLSLILFTGFRAWKIAVDKGTQKSLIPLVLLLALLIQGVTESRLLLEGNLLLLFLIVFYVQNRTPVFVELVGGLRESLHSEPSNQNGSNKTG